jgi:hypothetical protein
MQRQLCSIGGYGGAEFQHASATSSFFFFCATAGLFQFANQVRVNNVE